MPLELVIINFSLIRMMKCMPFSSRKENHQPPMNSRSPNRHFILSALKILIKRSIKLMRSIMLERPRFENVTHIIRKATPEWTIPSAKGLIFSFPDFQFVRSIDKSHFLSRTGRNRTISQAMPSIEKTDPAKKRCWRLYFESVLALPGIAAAISVRQTVRTFNNAIMKQDSRAALALFQPGTELNIFVSFAIRHMKFTSFMVKSRTTS